MSAPFPWLSFSIWLPILFGIYLLVAGRDRNPGGVRAIARLLQRPDPPTAVLASNDQTAIGVLSGIRQAGLRVPEDISVVGFDDIDMAGFTEPPLTTVRLARTELANLACNALMASMKGGRTGCELRMSTFLVVRKSTARVSSGSVRQLTSSQHS